ncbi:hypothetical protein LTR56_004187 [Elasticomyces elasticus]|nr:hypothetical protein LTR56_004187 [Elasticomyces elasticus]KAK3655077.1 hypothetical protein LTR22_010386 [Elasticomyces elasticus]KAK4910872.1 hypothetical protein LTR49_020483 [Elasticomyces elasticus]KAK5750291.1 hypothetical protein LTS12_019629 [Elasticomyces elasticus]
MIKRLRKEDTDDYPDGYLRRVKKRKSLAKRSLLVGRGFFTLPAELRNAIYEIALPQRKTIFFSSHRSFHVPPLLHVCHQIRRETREMYYYGNSFLIETIDCKPGPCISWKRHYRALGFRKIKTDVGVLAVAEPDWDSLMDWCKAVHHGDAVGPHRRHRNLREGKVIVTAMKITRSFRGRPGTWQKCEGLLKGLRKAVASYDERWLH